MHCIHHLYIIGYLVIRHRQTVPVRLHGESRLSGSRQRFTLAAILDILKVAERRYSCSSCRIVGPHRNLHLLQNTLLSLPSTPSWPIVVHVIMTNRRTRHPNKLLSTSYDEVLSISSETHMCHRSILFIEGVNTCALTHVCQNIQPRLHRIMLVHMHLLKGEMLWTSMHNVDQFPYVIFLYSMLSSVNMRATCWRVSLAQRWCIT